MNQSRDSSSKRQHGAITTVEDSAVQDSRGMQPTEASTEMEAMRAALQKQKDEEIQQLLKKAMAAKDAEMEEKLAALKEENATLKEENATLKTANDEKVVELAENKAEEKLAALKEENATLKEENATLKTANDEKDVELAENKAIIKTCTIGGLIEWRDESYMLIKNLTASGTSHIHTPHEDATSSPAPFTLDSISYRDPKVNNMPSSGLAKTPVHRPKTYSNEASVQLFVGAILEDAVDYVNWVLAAMGNPLKLEAMPEASIFTNKPDHLVVYANDTFNIPIMCVEVKKPTVEPNKVFDSRSVSGQILDYIMLAKFMNGTETFGVLTTFNDSKIVWLDHETSNYLATVEGRLTQENLRTICQKAISTRAENPANPDDDTQGSLIGSPAAAVISPNASIEAVRETSSTKSSTPPKLSNETPHISRSIKASEHTYKPYELFSVFCNAMFASLQAGRNKCKIYPFENGGRLEEGHLVLHLWKKIGNKKAYNWHQLENPIEIEKGTWKFNKAQEEFYVVEHLGAGSTSRAWRAVVVQPSNKKRPRGDQTETGYSCVIKYWIKDHDLENGERLDATESKDQALEAVNKEKENYDTIYKSFTPLVGIVELNSRWCIILPFFPPLQKKERTEKTLEKITEVLMVKFYDTKKKISYQFEECDQRWRHVGKYNGEIVLFDLAELKVKEKSNKAAHKKYVKGHIAVLTERMD